MTDACEWRPPFIAVVMVGRAIMRREEGLSRDGLAAFTRVELQRPVYRRTMFVIDGDGEEIVACELGLPEGGLGM